MTYIEIAMAGFVCGLGSVFAIWKLLYVYRVFFGGVEEAFRND